MSTQKRALPMRLASFLAVADAGSGRSRRKRASRRRSRIRRSSSTRSIKHRRGPREGVEERRRAGAHQQYDHGAAQAGRLGRGVGRQLLLAVGERARVGHHVPRLSLPARRRPGTPAACPTSSRASCSTARSSTRSPSSTASEAIAGGYSGDARHRGRAEQPARHVEHQFQQGGRQGRAALHHRRRQQRQGGKRPAALAFIMLPTLAGRGAA